VSDADRAYRIIGAFAKCRRRGLPPGVLAALRGQAEALLAEGIEEDRIRRGLNAWHGAGDPVAAFRSHVRALR
jgi:hypothetical protein